MLSDSVNIVWTSLFHAHYVDVHCGPKISVIGYGRRLGVIILSVCPSVCLWRCALCLNDTSYSENVWRSE